METEAKERTCTTCGTKETDEWRGIRTGRILCNKCYKHEMYKKNGKKKKKKVKVYDMWGS